VQLKTLDTGLLEGVPGKLKLALAGQILFSGEVKGTDNLKENSRRKFP
jgi:hypothetical protein